MTEQQIRQDKALRPATVATRLDINIKTVYAMIGRGDLQGFRAGNGWRIYESSLLKMMQPTISKKQL